MASPVKTCLCSPTSHPGSFRCRFHRALEKKWPHPVSPRYNFNIDEEASSGMPLNSPPPLRLKPMHKQVESPRITSTPAPISTETNPDSPASLSKRGRIIGAEKLHKVEG
eukprot:c24586_g1_i1 orf=119-448(+)